MKTKFEIEIETKDMKEVKENEDGTGADVTKECEEELHKAIKETIQELFKKEDYNKEFLDGVEDRLFDEHSEILVEGFESLDDYGNVSIKVK